MIHSIKKVLRLMFYLAKRQLKRRSLWMIVFASLGGCFFISYQKEEKSSTIEIGLYVEEVDNYSKEEEVKLTEKLQGYEQQQSVFSFVIYDEIATLRAEIVAGNVECGYVIPGDLWEKLAKGKTKNLVTLYTTATTTLDGICNEVVYAALYEEYALFLLNDYLMEAKELPFEELLEMEKITEPIYKKYLTNGSTFGFRIAQGGGGKQNDMNLEKSRSSALMYPLRGFLAIFVLVCGFCGTMTHYEDEEKRLFIRQTRVERTILRFIGISIPVLFSCPLVLGALWISRVYTDWYKETTSLLFYAMIVILFCGIMTYGIRDKLVFCSWIPLLLIGCIVFTPVLFQISTFLPQMRFVEKIFVPYYYLRLFL